MNRNITLNRNNFCFEYEKDYTKNTDIKNILSAGITAKTMFDAINLIKSKENSRLLKLPLSLNEEAAAFAYEGIDYSNIENLSLLTDITGSSNIKTILDCIMLCGDEYILLKVQGPFSCLLSIVGSNHLFKWLCKYEKQVDMALESITDGLANYIIDAVNSGANIISLAEPSGMIEILGEKKYKRYVAEYIIKLMQKIEPNLDNALVHICPLASTSLEKFGYVSSLVYKSCKDEYIKTLVELSCKKDIKFIGHRCINAENATVDNIYMLSINNGGLMKRLYKMQDKDWHEVSRIYLEGILSNKATVVKELPSFEEWNSEHDKNLRFVIKDQDKIIGFAAVINHKPSAILSVYVKNEYKRQGVGSMLISELKAKCQEYGFDILKSLIFSENIESIKLHEKMGFIRTDTVKVKNDKRDVYVFEWRP